MKCRIRYIAILLLAGLATNLFFAYTAPLWQAYSVSPRTGAVPRSSFTPELEALADRLDLSPNAEAFVHYRWNLVRETFMRDWLTWSNEYGQHNVLMTVYVRHEVGLPFTSFVTFRTIGIDENTSRSMDINEVTIDQSGLFPRPRLGLIPNTIILAAIFWGLLWLGRRLDFAIFRRRYRRLRGCCPECGYDLRRNFDAGCPECGWQRGDTQNAVG